MSGFRIRTYHWSAPHGWMWDLLVPMPPDLTVQGEVIHMALNRGGCLEKSLPEGFHGKLENLLNQMTSVLPAAGTRTTESTGMFIQRNDPESEMKKRYYDLPRLQDCRLRSPEAQIWELINSIFDGFEYPTTLAFHPGKQPPDDRRPSETSRS